MEGSECAGRREEGSPHRAPPTTGGKICGVCLLSCSRRTTWLPQLLETSPTISQTFSSPRTKDQIPGSQLCQVTPHTPSQEEDWDRSQKGHTVALPLCPAPPSAAQKVRARPLAGPVSTQCGLEGGAGGGGAEEMEPSPLLHHAQHMLTEDPDGLVFRL